MITEDKYKYYYSPTMTKNIMFVRGEKYVYLSKLKLFNMQYHHIYTVHDFVNDNVLKDILFRDEFGSFYRISSFDVGYFMSLKQYRKRKLEKIMKINE